MSYSFFFKNPTGLWKKLSECLVNERVKKSVRRETASSPWSDTREVLPKHKVRLYKTKSRIGALKHVYMSRIYINMHSCTEQ